MADYKKMYAILCGAIDDVIDTLEEIPLAFSSAKILRNALEQAEEIYIETTPYIRKNVTNPTAAPLKSMVFRLCGTFIRHRFPSRNMRN